MKATYKRLLDFSRLATNYLAAAAEAKEKDTPLSFGLEDCLEDIKPNIDEYNKKVSRLRRQYAEKDKKTTVLLKDQFGNLQFTEEGENSLEDAIDDLLDETVSIKPTYVTELPEGLLRPFIKGFTGFVIAPTVAEDNGPAKSLLASLPTTKSATRKPKNNGK